MPGRLRQPIWIIPLAAAGLVALFGAWGNTRLRQAIEDELKADLTATLNANVTALDIWMTNQTKLASLLAEEPRLRTIMTVILEKSDSVEPGFRDLPKDFEEFNSYLRPRLNQVNYDAAQLLRTNFVVVAACGPGLQRSLGTSVSEAHTNKFAELFASGKAIIITPYKPEPLPAPRPPFARGRGGPPSFDRPFGGPFRPRSTNSLSRGARAALAEAGRGRRGDRTLMQVAAPIKGAGGAVHGALALIINPDREFTRILSVARSGQSGETYAFDQHGLLISKSRFDPQLRELGLLDLTNTSSALNLRLHDPGGDLTKGFRPTDEASARPLIRIVTAAIAGEDSVEVEPSRDYRGVPVVGACRWFPELGFGVATQIDAAEAFQPLRVVQLIFIILFLLLVLCASIMFLFSYRDVVWRQRLSEAELKLKQLGQYTLEEKLGEGGMGVVYRARHALMRRDTAVKLLLPDRANAESIERFEREVCLTCQLSHPNTIQIFDYGHTPDGIFYYVMEYLSGLNLRDLVERYGPQSEGRVIHILSQVCEALAEAHGRGLVHRDIKPANIYLCERGGMPDCVKVLDFGLVRVFREQTGDRQHLTRDEAVVGTPWFMSPEALKNSARSDPRSDIYAVGALGYFLLTAEFVFKAQSVLEIYEKQLTESPIPPSRRAPNPVSHELESTLLRCLNKEPALRPQSVVELRALLRTSPRAAEWGPELRAGWWTHFKNQQAQSAPAETQRQPAVMEATVRIDLGTRMEQP
jgi:Protein kinase domain